MTYSGTITYGGVTLQVPSITPKRVQKTIKQAIGKTLSQVNIIGYLHSSGLYKLTVLS